MADEPAPPEPGWRTAAVLLLWVLLLVALVLLATPTGGPTFLRLGP